MCERMKRRRPHGALGNHEWHESSLASDRTVDVSPLAELSKILRESIESTSSTLAAPTQDDILTYVPAHEGRLLREPWNSGGAPSCRARYGCLVIMCLRLHDP